jgi:PadR family transcriptional regulator, regulatory protein AphA
MSLRHAVLGLLTDGPLSGYDMLKIFSLSLENVWPATQSQLYGELGKLADSGLIEVVAEGPRGRKEYALTEAGRAELRHWVAEVEPSQVQRSDMLLRVFFLGEISPEAARTYLRTQAEHAQKGLEHLEGIRDLVESGTDQLSMYGRLALEYGLRMNRVQVEWAQWAEEQIS